jgi:hypothetical protein
MTKARDWFDAKLSGQRLAEHEVPDDPCPICQGRDPASCPICVEAAIASRHMETLP